MNLLVIDAGTLQRHMLPNHTICTPPWYENLAGLAKFAHSVSQRQQIETHISVVILTGEFAYKLKKPICLPFLDFRKIEDRLFYLQEELRLNQRTAPDIYIEIVPVCGNPTCPVFEGASPAFDYALKMKQFPQSELLTSVAERGALSTEHIRKLAGTVADFHGRIDRIPPSNHIANAVCVKRDMVDNFELLAPWAHEHGDSVMMAELSGLRRWTEGWLARHGSVIDARKRAGAVRECHGDMHLGNIVLLDGEPTLFDCIEFSEGLRWIDIANEIAFVIMDLWAHGRSDLATIFMNEYLQKTGDYDALRLLPGFVVYRALVRAKVASLTSAQAASCTNGPASDSAVVTRYIRLAEQVSNNTAPALLIITHGLSGSGKSWLAAQLAARLGAVQIRADVERKRINNSQRYGSESTELTYQRLGTLAELSVVAGYPVIVDATFLRRNHRARFVELANRIDVTLIVLSTVAPTAVLRQRIEQRKRRGTDPSEATVEVLNEQLHFSEPFTKDESAHCVVVDTSNDVNPDIIADQLRRRCKRKHGDHTAGVGRLFSVLNDS